MLDDFALIDRALAEVFDLDAPIEQLLDAFRAEISLQDLAAGDVLLRQGDPSDALYILLRGRLTVSIHDGETEKFIGEIRRGETIGETGLVMGAPRNATARASRASTVARIDAESFDRLLQQFPHLGLAIARSLITREQRNAGPRHPGFVPETICLVAVTPGIDLDRVAKALAPHHPGPVTVVKDGTDIEDGRRTIRAGQRDAGLVLALSGTDNPDWRAMAVAECDEVVRVADATASPVPHPDEARLDRGRNAILPRQTLLLVHPDDTRHPTGTAAWLEPRRIDRHLHARLGNACDTGRVARILTGRAVGLVLSGGGARGAAHLGAFRAMQEAGIEPDLVGGTSIGGAMAAWYAMGLRGEDIDAAARKVFVENGPPTNDWNLLPMVSLVKGRKTRVLAQKAIRAATGTDIGIEDTWTPYFCVAANYTRQTQTILRSGPLWKALTATYAIPGVLPPVILDGELHVDGGLVNNLPVDVLEASGAAHTIAVDLVGGTHRKLEMTDIPPNLLLLRDKLRSRKKRRFKLPGLIAILLNSTLLSALERQREMRARADVCLRPELTRISLLDWGKFNAAIDQSYESLRAQIETLPQEELAPLQTARARIAQS